ncbi:MAG: DUF2029 domain-containing protein [Candidatus Heimdallarchaeota archaeon]|nr:DUF2029 domain-containing protein [Candidatus Heimdallarchaeota archaeon]
MTGNEIIDSETEQTIAKSRALNSISTFSKKISNVIKKRLNKISWGEYSLEICIVAMLISIALFIRIVLAYEYRVNWGYGSDDIIWNLGLPFRINGVEFRGFADFGYYYYSWIVGWYENGWYPYQWTEPTNVYDYYSYPPVFLYFLVLTWRPGMNNFWMAFPMVFADAACAGVVYLILREAIKKDTSRIIAIIGGFLMALAPINVIYDGIYWLNPGPVTLLTLIAFYFALKNKWWQAFFWLAFATMTKQNALFFTLPMFMVMLGQKAREKTIREAIIESIMNAVLFIGVCFLLSIPYIFIDPYQYGRHMLFPGRGIEWRFDPVIPADNDCVSFATSLWKLGVQGYLLAIISFGTYNMFWMILSAVLIGFFMVWRSYRNKMDGIEFFEWISIYVILTHIFMPRGVYKFYVAYFVPFIAVALIGSITHYTTDKKYVALGLLPAATLFLWFNIWLLIMDRWAVPFYLFMVALTIALLAFVRADLKYVIEKKAREKRTPLLYSTTYKMAGK